MEENRIQNFGVATFDKKRMKKRVPYPTYIKWKNAVRKSDVLDKTTADIIAHAMKEWAIENGATHYCHWFQPLNGLTAKKHEAFLDRNEEMEPIIRFSGAELIKGEPDASSFPSGGIRSTFEARGYTYWDCTANSFIIDKIMYIPSIFVSYTGEVLDKKGPLLKSMDFVSEHGTRVVNLFSKEHIYRLKSKVGLEQEFFLIDKATVDKRRDLKCCGRTLVGAKPPKGQELEDHYFGSIPQRVMKFYQELNEELWRLGIYAKTEHNEVAPCQFEVAILYENTNIAIDNNLLCMEVLKKIALKNGMVCLLHEKPFAGVNGSGKHNNWSLLTNYGQNCFNPGDDPKNNYIFLLFVASVIKAVDEYATLLRIASSSSRNDYRLGGDEAPPAIISIYLGEDLEGLFLGLIDEFHPKTTKKYEIKIHNLAYVPQDESDRNRTSPFAFTGNKFEFRMLGSSKTAADVNIVLNTAVGLNLKYLADALEPYKKSPDLKERAMDLCKQMIRDHKRILYGGDNYDQEWIEEAERRGLPNHRTYLDALKAGFNKELFQVFHDNNILQVEEFQAIFEVGFEEIINSHSLEIRALMDVVNKDIVPSAVNEINELGNMLKVMHNSKIQERMNDLNQHLERILTLKDSLFEKYEQSRVIVDVTERAGHLQEKAIPLMEDIREESNRMELMISRQNWTISTYEDMFTSIQ